MDERCRITIVGERRRVDLALPVRAPIATYIDSVARLCAQDDDRVMPSAWSLATATAGPFAPERSLAELGIVDGQVLYLRDVIEDEFTEPVVHELGARVAEYAGGVGRNWDARTRAMAVTATGLAWLVSTLIVLALRRQVAGAVLVDFAAAAGVLLPVLARVTGRRGRPVPSWARDLVALGAVPTLALAAWRCVGVYRITGMDGRHMIVTSGWLAACALVGGALVGALLAFAASPGAATCATLLAAAVATALCGGLAMAKANAIQSAAVTAVVAYGLLTIAPMTAGRVVAFTRRRAAARTTGAGEGGDAVAGMVRSATILLVLWSGGLAVVIAAVLVPLAASRSRYAVATAGCLILALLLRAGAARLVAEAAPVGLAAAVGLLTLLLVGPGHLGWPHWASAGSAGFIAVALPIYGLRRLARSSESLRIARPRWMTGLSAALGGVGSAPALALFGVFGRFVELGQRR